MIDEPINAIEPPPPGWPSGWTWNPEPLPLGWEGDYDANFDRDYADAPNYREARLEDF